MTIEPKINTPPPFFRKNSIFLASLIFLLAWANGISASVIPGYGFYKKLTTQQSQISVGTTNLSNFPVLVRLTDLDLRHVSNGGKVQNMNGFDIVFTASDSTTLLNHQIEKYDPATGQFVVWVEIPVLSATANVDFFMFFGNSGVILNPSSSAIWDANFKGVWHLNTNQNDATINLNNLTANGTSSLAPGLAANAVSISPLQSLSQTASPLLQINGDLTLEAWVNFSTLQTGVGDNVIISDGDVGELGANNYHYALNLIGSGADANKLQLFWEFGTGVDVNILSTVSVSPITSTWHHISAVRDNLNGQVYFYFDGVQVGAAVPFSNAPDQGLLANFQIGQDQNTSTLDIDAGLDEVRISNAIRIPEWMQATYESIRAGSTFISYSTTACVPPGVADAGASQTICISTPTALLTGNLPTLGSGSWTPVFGTGSVVSPGSPVTLLTGLSAGPNIFSWTLSNGSCSSVDQVTVTVDALPGGAFAGVDQTVCLSSPATTLNATPVVGGFWSITQGSGTIASPLSATTSVSNMSLGINVLQWTVLTGVCAPNTDTMVIQVDDNPSPAVITTPNQTLCVGTPSTVLNGNNPGVGTGTWTFLQGIATLSNPNAGSSNLTGLSSSPTILRWQIANGTVCATSSATMTIILDPEVSTPTISPVTQTLCGATPNATVTAISPTTGTGAWSVISGTGTVGSGTTQTLGLFNNLGVGTNTIQYVISAAGSTCPSKTVTATIILDPEVSTPTISPVTQTLCGATPNATVTAISPTTGTGAWSVISNTGTVGSGTTQTLGLFNNLGVGTNTIQYVISAAGSTCPSKTVTATIKLDPEVSTPTISPVTQTLCGATPNATVTAISPTTGTGAWSVISGTGTVGSGTTQILGLFNNLGVGTNTIQYVISAAGSTCPSKTVTATIKLDPEVSTPTISPVTQTLCGATPNATVTAISPTTGTGAWSVISNTGTVGSGTTQTLGLFNNLGVGTNTIQYVISAAGSTCPSKTVTATIKLDPEVSTPTISPVTQTLCGATPNATVSAISPTTGTGAWSVISGTGTVGSGTTQILGLFNNLGVGTNTIQYVISAAGSTCPSKTVTATIKLDPEVSTPTISPVTQTLCGATPNATVTAISPTTGTGAWSVISNTGTVGSGTTQILGLFNNLGVGTNTIQYVISAAGSTCPSKTVTATIKLDPEVSTPTISPVTQTLCGATPNATVTAISPTTGTGAWSVISGTGTVGSGTTQILGLFNNLGVGTNSLQYVVVSPFGNSCPSKTVIGTVILDPEVSTPTISPVTQTLCGATPNATVTAISPTTGTGAWSVISNTGTVGSGTTQTLGLFNNLGVGTNTIQYVISAAGSTCPSKTVTATIKLDPEVSTPTISPVTQTLCGATPNATVTAISPTTGTGAWSVISGTGTVGSGTTQILGLFNNLGVGTNTIQYVISAAGSTCPSKTVTATIKLDPEVSTPTISPVTQTLCGATPNATVTAISPTTGTGAWSVISNTGTVGSGTTQTLGLFNNLGVGTNTIQYVISAAGSTCPSKTVTATIKLDPEVSTPTISPVTQTLCGATPNATVTAISPTTGTGAWSVISGTGTVGSGTTQILGLFNNLGVGTNSLQYVVVSPFGNSCPSKTVIGTVILDPEVSTPTISPVTQTLCGATPNATVTAISPTTGTGAWSVISGTGTVGSGTTQILGLFNNLGVGTNTIQYVISAAGSTCPSKTVTATIILDPEVSTPTISPVTQTLCGATPNATVTAISPTTGTGAWSVISNTGTVGSGTTQTLGLFNNLGVGTNTIQYVISAAGSTCPSKTVTATIKLDPEVSTPTISPVTQTLCGATPNATVTAISPTTGTGAWSVISGTGTVGSGTTQILGLFNNLGVGTNSLQYVVVSPFGNSCPSKTVIGTVILDPEVSTPTISPVTQTLCGATPNATVTAISPTTGTGAWSVISNTGTVGSGTTQTLGLFNNLGVGTNTIQYVISAAGSTCPSKTVTATIKLDPEVSTPTISPVTQTLCGATPNATVTAISPTTGTGAWSVISGTGTVGSGTTQILGLFNNLGVGTNTIQYVISAAGSTCPSKTVTATIKLDPEVSTPTISPVTQTLCGATPNATVTAISPTTGTGAWSVISNTGTVGSGTTQTLGLFNNLGVGTNTIQYVISAAGSTCPSKTVTATIKLDPEVSTPTISPVTQTLCGATPNATVSAISPTTGTGAWSVISGTGTVGSGTTQILGLFNNLGVGTNTIQYVISAAGSTCPSKTVTATIKLDPEVSTPTISPVTQTLCGATPNATVTAISPTTGTGAWSVISNTGTVGSGTTQTLGLFNNLGVGTNTIQYVISAAGSTCPSKTVTATIKLDPEVSTPTISPVTQTLCGATPNATVSAISPTTGTGAWSVISGTGTVGSGTTQILGLFNNLGVGTNTIQYVISAAGSTCPSKTVTATIKLDPEVSTPTISPVTQTLCGATPNATVTAISPTTGTGAWSVISNTGTVGSGTTQILGLFNNLGVGTNTIQYVISAAGSTCPSKTVTATIKLDPEVSTPTISPVTQTLCGATPNATVTAISPTTGTGAWSVISGTGTVGSGTTQILGLFNNLGVGTNSLQYVVVSPFGNSCPSKTVIGTVILDPEVSTPTISPVTQTLCGATPNATVTAISPTTGAGAWSVISNTGTVGSGTTQILGLFNNLGVGTNTIQYVISAAGSTCPSKTVTATIKLDPEVSTPTISPVTQTLCGATPNATVTAISPTTGAGAWSVISNTGTVGSGATQTLGLFNNLGVGTNTIQYVISAAGSTCPSKTVTATIKLDPEVSTPTISPVTQTLCGATPNATVSAISPTTGTGAWSVISGTGTVGSGTTQILGLFNNLGVGTNTIQYVISAAGSTCPSKTVTATIKLDPEVSTPTISPVTQTLCGATPNATVTAISPTTGTGAWSVISGTGTVGSGTTQTLGLFNNLGVGTNTIQYVISAAGSTCPSKTVTGTVIVDPANSTPTIMPLNQSICASTPNATVTALTLSIGIGSWSVLSNTGSVSGAVTAQTGSFVNLGLGTNTVQYVVGAAGNACPNKSVTAIIIVDPVTSIASAGANQTICISTATAPLAAGTFTTGVPSWSVPFGSGVVSNSNVAVTTVTNLSLGTNILRFTLGSVGVCPSSSSTMTIQVDQAPTPASVGSTQTLCINSPVTTLSGNSPLFGSGFWSVSVGSATISGLATSNSQATLALGINILRWQTTFPGVCPASNASLTIKVDQLSQQATTGSNYTICTNSNSGPLSGNAPITPNTGSWTLVSGVITGIPFPTSPTSPATGMGVGLNVFQWSLKNGVCPATAATMTVQVDDNPAASVAGVVNQTICAATPTTLLAGNTPPPFQGTGTWSVVGGSGTITSVSNPSTTVTNLAITTNTLQWTISNNCGSTTSSMTIQVDQLPTASIAGTNIAACSQTPAGTPVTISLNANQPTIGVGSWTVAVGSGIIANTSTASTTFTNVGIGDNILQWSITNGVCPPSTSSIQVHIDDYSGGVPAGPGQTLCISSPSTTLAAVQPTAGSTNWVVLLPLNGGVIVTNSLLANSTVTNLQQGLNILSWSAINGACGPTQALVNIYVDPLPTTASITTASQTLCVTNSVITIVANPTLGTNPGFPETGTWSFAQGSGTLANANAASTTATLNLGINRLVWTISNGGGCGPSTATVQLIVAGIAGTANAGTNQTVCASSASTTLGASIPSGGVGTWSFSIGSGSITNILDPTSTVTGLATGTNILAWTLSSPCNGAQNTATVMIVVDPAPTSATAGANQTICMSTPTAALVGNASIGATTWSLISGNGVITNSTLPSATFTALSTGTNIISYSTSNGVCLTTSTLSIVVNSAPSIATTAGNQSICISSPTTALTGNIPTSGLGTWSLVSGPGGAIITPTLGTSTMTALTIGTTTLAWTIANSGCPSSTTLMTIQVFSTTGAAFAGPSQTICSSTPTTVLAGNSPSVGIGTWSITIGSGSLTAPNLSTTAVTSLSVGTNLLQWKLTNGACFSSSTMSIQVDNAPTPATTGPTQSICITTPTTALTGNIPLVGSPMWSLISGSPPIILTPSLGTSPLIGLTIGTVSLRWSISNGICATSSSTLNIITFDVPGTAVASPANQTLCVSSPSLALSANAPTLGVGNWSVVAGSGSITTPSSYSSVVTSLSVGINTLEWKLTNGGCISTSSINIKVDDLPTSSNAGTNQAICISTPSITLGANTPITGTGLWSVVSGTATINNPTLATSTATNFVGGANVLQWTISNGSCGSSASSVTIQVDNLAQTAIVGSSQTVCVSTGSTTLVANTPTFGVGAWSVVSGTASITNPTLAASTVTGLATGTNVLRWTITNGGCSTSATMSIKVDALPDVAYAGPNQTLCISTPTTVLAANTLTNGTGLWSLISGTGLLGNNSSPTSSIAGLSVGTNSLSWNITNGLCGSSSATVGLLVDAPPQVSPAGVNQILCISTPTTTLAAFTPTLGSGVWSVQTGTASIVTPTLATSTVTGLTTGTNVLVWTVSNGGCFSTSSMSIAVDAMPDMSNAGPNQTLCISSPSTILAANTITTGVGTWSLMSGGGTITNTLSPVSTVTNLASGPNILRWTMSNGSCASNSTSVLIQVDNGAGIANAGANQTICISTGSTTVIGNPPSLGLGTWSLVSGTVTIVAPTSPTSQITGLTVGTHVLKWTLSNGTCSNSANMSIKVDALPGVAIAGSNQTLCINSPSTMLAATTQTFGTAAWSVLTASGTVNTPTSPTSIVTGLGTGTNILQWQVSNGVCAPNISTILVQVDSDPGTANAGPSQTICVSSPTVMLAGNTPTFGGGIWSVTPGSGSVTTATSATTTATNLSLGLNTLQWKLTNGACSNTSSMTVKVDDVPDNSVAGLSQSLCISSPNTTLAANSPTGAGIGTWSVLSGGSVLTNSALATSSVTGLTSGVNVLQWSVSNGVCAVKTSTVSITVDELPSPAFAGSTQTICSGGTTLSAVVPSVGVGSWSLVSGAAVINTPSLATSSVSNITSPLVILQWINSNGVCASSSATMSIQVDDLLGSVFAGPSATICPDTYTMSATILTKGTGMWSVRSGSAAILTPTNPLTPIANLAIGKNSFVWTVVNGSCPQKADSITITRDAPADSAFAGRDTTINISRFQLTARQPSLGTGGWQVVSGYGVFADYTDKNTLVTDLNVGENIVKWKVTGACGFTEDDIRITVIDMLIPNAISPNGDGKNDYFVIPNIVLYSTVELTVINRWGSVVFESKNYDNKWNGTNSQNMPLTEDTYFYTLKLGETMKTGFIIVKR